MSSRKISLDELGFRLASELPDTFEGRIDDIRFKTDRHGRKIMVFEVYTDNWGKVFIAYSPSYMNMVRDQLKKLGFKYLDDVIGKWFLFKRVQLPKARPDYTDPYPRHIPVDYLGEEEEEEEKKEEEK